MSTVAVIGLGLLGRGIAACFLSRGYHVVGIDKEPHAAQARTQIEALLEELKQSEGLSRYTSGSDFGLVKDCTFVVESVTEDIATKESVFDVLEAILPSSTVIASNTSAIPISQLQASRKFPERFVGMHWAEPAHATRFMELIRGEKTSDETFHTAEVLARRLGKEPCAVQRDLPGFIANRVGYAMYREALQILESGVADIATIDCALRNSIGLWAGLCGPFRWMDLTGGPELYAKSMRNVSPTGSQLLDDLAANGARGIANGRGFYSYTKEEAHAWEELYRKHAQRIFAHESI